MMLRAIRKKWPLATVLLILLVGESSAQLIPASPPVADPADRRFHGVTEDWTSPSLAQSTLRAAQPLVGYKNDYPRHTVELIQLQWRFGDPLDVYVIKPKGVTRPPVILYLYGFPTDTERFKDPAFQSFVTSGGFAAVGFVPALTGHRYHDRPMREWFISEMQEALSTSAHDVQMVLNYLETRGDLDMDRTGVFSQGSGATIAILASGVDARIKALDTIDPWGDWPTWMAHSPFIPEDERADYLRPAFLESLAGLDPVTWIPKIRALRFRMQDALFDLKTPTAAKEKLRNAVSPNGTVVVYKSIDEFNDMVRRKQDLVWIQEQLLGLPAATKAQVATK